MSACDEELWKKIDALQLDAPDAALPFSKRLKRENAWSLEYTNKVIEEYKRFIYLVASGSEALSPSDRACPKFCV